MSKNERYLAKIQVTLKPTVNDPEGNTIAGALASLNFSGVEGVRAGKYFEVTLEASGKKKATKLVEEMCSRLLANPVIETYRFEIQGVDR